MRDVELYGAILGLTPSWRVVNVDLDVKGQQVVVKVDAGPGPFRCPECEQEVARYDRRLRRWRHLDTCQFTTWIEGEIPRLACPSQGVKRIRIPWAEPHSQFTALFERFAIDLLRECSVAGAAALLHVHDAVDQVRRSEHRTLKRSGDDTLTGSKYLWLMRPEEMTSAQRVTFRALGRSDLKVARAWRNTAILSAFSLTGFSPARILYENDAGGGAKKLFDQHTGLGPETKGSRAWLRV